MSINVDHVLKCAGIAVLVFGMAASGLVSLTLALAVLIAYFLVSIELCLATYCRRSGYRLLASARPGCASCLLAIGNIVAPSRQVVELFGEPRKLFDVGVAVPIPALVIALGTSAIRNGRSL